MLEKGTKELLGQFWDDFSEAISETSELRITEVLDVLDDALAPQLYPAKEMERPKELPEMRKWSTPLEIIAHWRICWMWKLSRV